MLQSTHFILFAFSDGLEFILNTLIVFFFFFLPVRYLIYILLNLSFTLAVLTGENSVKTNRSMSL